MVVLWSAPEFTRTVWLFPKSNLITIIRDRECAHCRRIMDAYVASLEGQRLPEISFDSFSDPTCHVHEAFVASAWGHPLQQLPMEIPQPPCRQLPEVRAPSMSTPSAIFQSEEFDNEFNKLILVRQRYNGKEVGIGRALDPEWIDMDLIRQWTMTCIANHRDTCEGSYFSLIPVSLPWVIDTDRYCLVPGFPGLEYVTLSYVWGAEVFLKTTRSLLQRLRMDGSLSSEGPFQLPRTAQHAIALCKSLGERYLWIDALCIVQDDEEIRNRMIASMTSVYANAKFTIIAADGDDANHGLRGLRGISQPRRLQSEPFDGPFGSRFFYQPIKRLKDTKWNSRGWTFQEYVFSPRRLIFIGDSIRWECRQCCCWEEIWEAGKPLHLPDLTPVFYDQDHSAVRLTALFHHFKYPHLPTLENLISSYNMRDLSHGNDIIPAFMGIITAFRPMYSGGFIWGLPSLFLDQALLWWNNGDHLPRRRTSFPSSDAPPSWTWAAWQGKIGFQGSDECTFTTKSRRWNFPLVEWYAREDVHSEDTYIEKQNEWYHYRRRYMGHAENLPPGWTHESIEISSSSGEEEGQNGAKSYSLYRHSAAGSTLFCHPIPILDTFRSPQSPDSYARIISCRAQQVRVRTWGMIVGFGGQHKSTYALKVRDYDGMHIADLDPTQPAGLGTIAIVAISAFYTAEYPVQPGCENAEFVEVLCVEWQDEVASRVGSGSVSCDVWDSLEKEWVDLVLC